MSRTTPLLFATRWITHLCAPIFAFRAGVGAGLQRLRGKPAGAMSRFLWTRGLWLMLLYMLQWIAARAFGILVTSVQGKGIAGYFQSDPDRHAAHPARHRRAAVADVPAGSPAASCCIGRVAGSRP